MWGPTKSLTALVPVFPKACHGDPVNNEVNPPVVENFLPSTTTKGFQFHLISTTVGAATCLRLDGAERNPVVNNGR